MDSPEEKEPPEVITSDTNNATTIQPKEAPPSKREKFRRLRAYNTGVWNGPKRENKEVARRQDDLQRYDSISSSLSLTDYQKRRGRKIFDDLDFHTLGESIDVIIFAVCVHVANEAVSGYRYYPDKDAKSNDELFEEVADSLGIPLKKQTSMVEKIRGRV